MHVFSNTQRIRQRRTFFRLVISFIGLAAIFILLYLIGHLPLV
jgi:hypothetical protein